MSKDWDVSVSPAEGIRKVRVIKSALRDPITVISGCVIADDVVGMIGDGSNVLKIQCGRNSVDSQKWNQPYTDAPAYTHSPRSRTHPLLDVS